MSIARRSSLAVLLLALCFALLSTWNRDAFQPIRWKSVVVGEVAPSFRSKVTSAIPSPSAGFEKTDPQVTAEPSPDLKASQDASCSTQDCVLVVAQLKSEDTSWIHQELPGIRADVYVVDDPYAEHRVPANKGHEAMVYLTYIIDNYDALPSVSIFAHAHRITWHNNDLLDSDMVKAIRRLNLGYVQEHGYMNLRCHAQPGCRDNLHLDATEKDANKPEVMVFREVWSQLHPDKPLPKTLSAPCCAQFAVSRDRIRSISRRQFEIWRDWLIGSKLEDRISGRIWEYTWHYIFSGQADLCPHSHSCYCGGFNVCFPSAAALEAWFGTRDSMRDLEEQQRKLDPEKQEHESKSQKNKEYQELSIKIAALESTLEAQKAEALQRGLNPDLRQKALTS